MEPNETLQEEVRHDSKLRIEALVGGLILLVIILAGVIWYMATHAPGAGLPGDQASTTPGVSGTAHDQVISENAAYYEVKAVYPSSAGLTATAGAAADAKAVEIMKQFELNTIDGFKEQGNFAHLTAEDVKVLGFDQGRKESLEIKYEMKSSPKTVSYMYSIYMDTFGAHPNTFFRTFTFDKKTGAGLDISDLFMPGTAYLKTLSTESRKRLPATIAQRESVKVSEVDTDYMNRGTTPDPDNFQNWYIEGGNLVIVFPPYQVAPYAAGMQLATIPLAQLPSLNPAYR
jgi:hypothetical protein